MASPTPFPYLQSVLEHTLESILSTSASLPFPHISIVASKMLFQIVYHVLARLSESLSPVAAYDCRRQERRLEFSLLFFPV